MTLSSTQKSITTGCEIDFSDLKAVIFNATLKHPSQESHTDTLLDVVAEIFSSQGVGVTRHRLPNIICPPASIPT